MHCVRFSVKGRGQQTCVFRRFFSLFEPDTSLLSSMLGVAFTSKMLNPRQTANGDWSFQKVFGDADFIAAGVLVIPPKGRKPSKGTKDNTYVRPFTLRSTLE